MQGFEQKFKSEFRALNLPAFIVPFDRLVFQMDVILSADGRQRSHNEKVEKERRGSISTLLPSLELSHSLVRNTS